MGTIIISVLWRVFTWTMPLPIAPLALILAAAWGYMSVGGWVSERAAVRAAVGNLVAGERIAALEAQIDARQKIAERAQALAVLESERRANMERALEQLERSRAGDAIRLENLNDEIAEMLARPAPDRCVVSPDLHRRMRAR